MCPNSLFTFDVVPVDVVVQPILLTCPNMINLAMMICSRSPRCLNPGGNLPRSAVISHRFLPNLLSTQRVHTTQDIITEHVPNKKKHASTQS